MLRMRHDVPSQIDSPNLESGFLNSCVNSFWQQEKDRFPFQGEHGISIRGILESWNDWPTESDFFVEDIHPENSGAPNWTTKGQGITASSSLEDWYFGEHQTDEESAIWRIDLSTDIDVSISLVVDGENRAKLGSSYVELGENHFGGIDHFDDMVWVAVHYDSSSINSRILRFDVQGSSPKLQFRDGISIPRPPNDGIDLLPWIAILGESQYAVSCDFNDSGSAVELVFFDIDQAVWGPSQMVTVAGVLPLYTSAVGNPDFDQKRLQGAAFGAHQHFYLISDEPDSEGGGVYGFDIVSGCQMLHIVPSDFGVPESTGGGSLPKEYQDLCILDTSGLTVHSKAEGTLHLLVQDDDFPSGDEHSILHLNTTLNLPRFLGHPPTSVSWFGKEAKHVQEETVQTLHQGVQTRRHPAC